MKEFGFAPDGTRSEELPVSLPREGESELNKTEEELPVSRAREGKSDLNKSELMKELVDGNTDALRSQGLEESSNLREPEPQSQSHREVLREVVRQIVRQTSTGCEVHRQLALGQSKGQDQSHRYITRLGYRQVVQLGFCWWVEAVLIKLIILTRLTFERRYRKATRKMWHITERNLILHP